MSDDVIRFIRRYVARHGFPPTQAEIAAGCGLTPSTARRRIAALCEAGLIENPPRKRRAIRIAGGKGKSWPV